MYVVPFVTDCCICASLWVPLAAAVMIQVIVVSSFTYNTFLRHLIRQQQQNMRLFYILH